MTLVNVVSVISNIFRLSLAKINIAPPVPGLVMKCDAIMLVNVHPEISKVGFLK